jgi:hypothetical protein
LVPEKIEKFMIHALFSGFGTVCADIQHKNTQEHVSAKNSRSFQSAALNGVSIFYL